MVSKKYLLALLFLFLVPVNLFAEPTVALDVYPKSGTIDDTFVLSVTVQGTNESEWPILDEEDNFFVHTIGPETSIQVINGRVESKATFRYQLTPKTTGEIKTPGATLSIGGKDHYVEGIKVLVSKTEVGSLPGSIKEVFSKQSIDTKEAYVGEQIVNTLTIYSASEVAEISLDDYAYDGFWATDIGKAEKAVSTIKSNRFRTIRLKKALYPLSAGDFAIPQRRATLSVQQKAQRKQRHGFDIFGYDPFDDPFFGGVFGTRLKKVTIHSNDLSFTVKPLPTAPANFPTLPGDHVIVGPTSISAEYDSTAIDFGQSKTLTITLKSEGNLNPIKSVPLTFPKDLQVYEETPQRNQYEVAGKLISEISFVTSLVPETGGKVEIKGLALPYFNTETKSYDLAKTPPISFFVNGGPKTKTAPATQAQSPEVKVTETLPTYKEETFLQSLSQKISLSLALLIIAAVALIVFIFMKLTEHTRKERPLKKIKEQLDSAATLDQLHDSTRRLLLHQLGRSDNSISNEKMKLMIKKSFDDSNRAFVAQTLLDEFDLARFSNQKEINLESLRSKAKTLL